MVEIYEWLQKNRNWRRKHTLYRWRNYLYNFRRLIETHFEDEENPLTLENVQSNFKLIPIEASDLHECFIAYITEKESNISGKAKATLGVIEYLNHFTTIFGKQTKKYFIKLYIDFLEWKSTNPQVRIAIPQNEWKNYMNRTGDLPLYIAIFIGFYYGLRPAEICHLRTMDIKLDPNDPYIDIRPHLEDIKTGTLLWIPKATNSTRKIGIFKDHLEYFEDYLEGIKSKKLNHPYIILNSLNLRLTTDRFYEKMRDLRKPDDKYCFMPYSLRFSFATWLYEDTDYTLRQIADELGHKNQKTTEIYLRLHEKAKRRRKDKLLRTPTR